MATIAGHRLTLDPMGKCSNAFFSETTNMIKAKLYMNVHWMVLYNLKVFCSDMKFKMAATTGLSLTLDPKLCINHWKVLYKLCVFYVDRNSKMTTTAGHSFYIGPISFFYNQVNDTGS